MTFAEVSRSSEPHLSADYECARPALRARAPPRVHAIPHAARHAEYVVFPRAVASAVPGTWHPGVCVCQSKQASTMCHAPRARAAAAAPRSAAPGQGLRPNGAGGECDAVRVQLGARGPPHCAGCARAARPRAQRCDGTACACTRRPPARAAALPLVDGMSCVCSTSQWRWRVCVFAVGVFALAAGALGTGKVWAALIWSHVPHELRRTHGTPPSVVMWACGQALRD